MIQLFSPTTGPEERAAIEAVLDSRWLGKGQAVTLFESDWARHVGVSSANMASTNSCTSALFEAVRLAMLEPGDEVIIPTIHFVGAAQAVYAAGLRPVFCDVDKWTLNATYETIKAKLTQKTKAVIMNHYGGNLARIVDQGDLGGLIWIDDLANAPMVSITDLSSDYAVWSFDATKIVTCGDGGLLYCRDLEKAKVARSDLYLGTDTESGFSSKSEGRWWEFFVINKGVGRNIMNDIQASIGLAQLPKLEQFVSRRLEIAKMYDELLSEKSVAIDMRAAASRSAYFFYWLYSSKRDALAKHLRENGIYVSWRYHPLHLAFEMPTSLPNSEWASRNALLLPLHQSLTDKEVSFIANKVIEFHRS